MVHDGRASKQALKDNHQELRTGLIVNSVLPKFRPYLTDVEYSLVEGQSGNVAQVDELVKILLTKENSHIDSFCGVCERNGYPHWAQKLKTAALGKQEAKGTITFGKSRCMF